MTQYAANFNAETNIKSNGTKYALICSSALFSNTLSLSPLSMWKTNFHTQIKQKAKSVLF